MSELRELSFADDAGRKRAVVDDAVSSLLRVTALLADPDSLLADLARLAPRGTLPNFVELTELARQNGVRCTPDLAALLAGLGLGFWTEGGAQALTVGPYLSFDQLAGEPGAVELLRALLGACAQLAGYHLGDESDRSPASEAFRLLAVEVVDRDRDVAVACALDACGLARTGSDVTAAAAVLIQVAGTDHEDAARLGLAYRVLGLCLNGPDYDAAARLELHDAFEAACRYRPEGPAREAAGRILAGIADRLDFLPAGTFLWRCAFAPDGLAPGLPFARDYVDAVWDYDDATLGRAVNQLRLVVTEMENRRLAIVPPDQDSVALADLNRWSVEHRAFRRAVPFAASLSREADESDILLTLSHEMIHIQSVQGWLGIHLHALRIAATECEVHLLRRSGEMPGAVAADEFPSSLAALTDERLVTLALVEQQLELIRKSQLLRAIWLPWLEGVAIFGELSADPSLDRERSTAFGDVVSSLNDRTPGEVATARSISLLEASLAIRTEAEARYTAAIADSGRARLRSYLDASPGRYLAGYLAVRGVLASFRRSHPFTGLSGYQAVLGATTMGTRSAIPPLTLSPAEFEERARGAMLGWLARIAGLDAESVRVLGTGARWDWVSDGSREHVVTMAEAPASPRPAAIDPIAEITALATGARVPRRGRASEFGNLPPWLAVAVGDLLDTLGGVLPRAVEPLAEALTEQLGDYISLVPIGQVSAPFWLVPSGAVPRLVLGIRVTETERQTGAPSYSLCVVPLSAEQLAELQDEMRLLRSGRMLVYRYADAAGYRAGTGAGRGLGRNVLGLIYGDFTMVLPAGQFTGTKPSPSLVGSVNHRLRRSGSAMLDETVASGRAVARRAIAWIESPGFAQESGALPEFDAWARRVLDLARLVLKDDDVALVTESSELILAELGWPGGAFAGVRESGLRALYDEDSPVLAPLLDAAMDSASGQRAADVSDLPDRVRSLLFEATEHGYDFRRWRGAGS
ncbi:MAG: hypothetical protein M0030_01055 [Actinomycetota bacterium]|nr:hypothetical protein [Actinomycetota bacterium]